MTEKLDRSPKTLDGRKVVTESDVIGIAALLLLAVVWAASLGLAVRFGERRQADRCIAVATEYLRDGSRSLAASNGAVLLLKRARHPKTPVVFEAEP